MKNNFQTNIVYLTEQLEKQLSSTLTESKSNLLRVANIKLVTLFWNIGLLLIQSKKQKKHTDVDFMLMLESKSLITMYGGYFSRANLHNMMRFATQFPSLSVPLIASIVGWEHISVLLVLDDDNRRLYFFNLAIKQNLTPRQLEDRITQDDLLLFRNQSINSHMESKRIDSFFELFQSKTHSQIAGKSMVEDFLFDSAPSDFRQFIESSQAVEYINYESASELCKVLADLIETAKQDLNNWLNAEVNNAFWEIGTQVNNELHKHTVNEYDSKKLLRVTTTRLNKTTNCNFSAKHLSEMATVAEHIVDVNIMLYLSQLIRWEHFVVLCHIEDIKEKILYARLTSAEGLSVQALKKRIKNQKDKWAIESGDIDWIVKALLYPTISEGKIKQGNNTFKWKKHFIPISDDPETCKSTSNIYQNPHFKLLLPNYRRIRSKILR